MKKTEQHPIIFLYFFAFAISILLSIVSIAEHPVFNPDGVRYLWGAYLYQSQGLHASMQYYAWPFYSMTIAWLSKLSGLSLLNAAYCLNALFSAMTVLVFIKIIKQISGNTRLMCWAALIVLVWQEFNGYRFDLIRGHGYWLFLLLSMYCFFKFLQKNHWRFAVLCSVCLLIATLYRVEGLVLLLLLPFVVFVQQHNIQRNFMAYCQLNFVTLLVGLALIIYLIIHVEHHSAEHLGRLSDPAYFLTHLSGFSHLPLLSVYSGLLTTVLSWGYLIVVTYAFATKALPKNNTYTKAILWFIFLNVLLSIVTYYNYQLLSQRYLVPTGFALLFFVPFGFDQLLQDWRQHKTILSLPSLLLPIVLLLMLVMLVGSVLYFGPSKIYVQQAVIWLKQQGKINLYTSEPIIAMRYKKDFWNDTTGWQQSAITQSPYDWRMINNKPWQGSDYAVFTIDHTRLGRRAHLVKLLGQPIKQFSNNRGDVAVVFKVNR